MSRNKEHRPNGAAAEGGRPIGGAAEGGASVFFVSALLLFYIMNTYGYYLYIPCRFPGQEALPVSTSRRPFKGN